MDLTNVLVLVLVWVAVGLITGLLLTRRGHDPRWTLVAMAMGPGFVPIAFSKVEERARRAALEPRSALPEPRSPGGLRVLVGLDESAQSRVALDAALDLLASRCGMLVLAEVVYYDERDEDALREGDEKSRRLNALAERAGEIPTSCQVLTGPPGRTLREYAREQGMDLIIVGRQGRGVSTKLLGSVASDLVHRSPVPVLVVGPDWSPRTAGAEAVRPTRNGR
ncbi:universal stress protein [Actinocorallia sp. B10E7]|uniref:universal stress protein n=1 Tax=Actinocorallia sp. B10E7 TaxID=3153558 RepID=UPI00325DEAE5